MEDLVAWGGHTLEPGEIFAARDCDRFRSF